MCIRDRLYDVDSIISDVLHEINSYMDGLSFDEARFKEIGDRLDVIHGIQSKYGATAELIERNLEEKKARLSELENYEELKTQTERELSEVTRRLAEVCGELSRERKMAAGELAEKIRGGLSDLNFLDVKFSMELDVYKRQNRKRLADMEETIMRRMEQILTDRKHRLALLSGRLHGQSPLQKLSRGFGFVTDPEGRRMVSVEQAEPGQQIEVRLTDGKMCIRDSCTAPPTTGAPGCSIRPSSSSWITY